LLLTIPLRTWALPVGVTDALGELGRLVAPAAMLALGLRFRVELAGHVRRPALWCLGTKMLLLPALVLSVAVLAGVTHDIAWRASVLEAGMPPMVTAGVVAVQAGLDEELSSFVVGAGLLLAAATLPLLRGALG
jgi:predicted permease